jgi:biotin carboxylase
VLALNGEKDLQVAADVNLPAIVKALKSGGNKAVTMMKLPELNHLFQHCKTGLPAEYGEIEETFSPEVLKIMSDWINGL